MTKKDLEKEELIEKLKYIGLDLNNIPKKLKENEPIVFIPTKMYDETSYKIYKYIDIKDIEILITPSERLDDISKKYKESSSLAEYLEPDKEESIEKYVTFIKMLENLSLNRLKQLEKEQEILQERIPYEIRYKENFIWQIYYSEKADKYFMLFPSNETRTESLFYLIKKKIEAEKSKKSQLIYVPICNEEYTGTYLKKSEIGDLENYLWLFTGEWPSIYELTNVEGKTSIEIIGETTVYEKIKSKYKISLNSKKQAQDEFKLIKALFILQSYDEELYKFRTMIDENGSLQFCYNLRKINYENLPEFISGQVMNKTAQINNITEKLLFETERLELLKESVQKQTEEFASKEKQIVMFLECKKTFFGKMKYFFKGKKKKQDKEEKIKELIEEKGLNEQKEEKITTELQYEKKELYTIEDLLNICKILENKHTEFKNIQMDIKALENKKQNLESKIRNATLYINEIEGHKKSIFDFWKYTSKDEVSLLNEAEIEEQKKESKIKKSFNYEEDIEDLGKLIDDKQRQAFSKNECDGIFAIRNDVSSFNIIGKPKILKRDDSEIQKSLNELKEEYNENIEIIRGKDFDIFGNIAEDKTKIKTLKNTKHREIEKDKYKILNIKPETTLEDYKENIKNYYNLIKELYGKIQVPYDMQVYKIDTEEMKEEGFEIFNINPEMELQQNKSKLNTLKLLRLNLKEKLPAIFYSNIMFYDNLNGTLPLGMDISSEVLVDLGEIDIKLVSRKDFNISVSKSNYENEIKTIQVYEYDAERNIKNDK